MIGPTWVPIFAGEWINFPGVRSPTSFVIIGILAVANGLYYVFITAVMPRSGGGSVCSVEPANLSDSRNGHDYDSCRRFSARHGIHR